MIKVLNPPAEEPVTLAEAKQFLRVDDPIDDGLILSLITASRMYFEAQTNIRIITQTMVDERETFPDGYYYLEGPVVSIDLIEYIDENGNWQEWDLDEVQSDLISNPARFYPADTFSYPSVLEGLGSVSVTYTAGYGAASAVPVIIKQGIKMLTAHWFAQRETSADSTLSEVPYACDAIIKMFSRGIQM